MSGADDERPPARTGPQTLAEPVVEELRRLGLEPGPGEGSEALRFRLHALYLERIRELKARLKAGEFPVVEYRHRVAALRHDHRLLALPLERWRD